jgi:hypothetical protein
MSTPKRKRNLLDFRQKREIVEIKNPSIYWKMMSSSDLDLMWTVRNHWKKVIFSDETKIEIGNNRKVYAWRKVDDRLRPECNGLYQGRNYKTKFSGAAFRIMG